MNHEMEPVKNIWLLSKKVRELIGEFHNHQMKLYLWKFFDNKPPSVVKMYTCPDTFKKMWVT